jgi:hypothetical protein
LHKVSQLLHDALHKKSQVLHNALHKKSQLLRGALHKKSQLLRNALHKNKNFQFMHNRNGRAGRRIGVIPEISKGRGSRLVMRQLHLSHVPSGVTPALRSVVLFLKSTSYKVLDCKANEKGNGWKK